MKFVIFGLYVLFLIFIWGFFIVAKLHAYKFKNFSTGIPVMTNILLVFLVFLSIAGAFIILFLPLTPSNSVSVLDSIPAENKQEIIQNIDNSDKYKDLDFNEINY